MKFLPLFMLPLFTLTLACEKIPLLRTQKKSKKVQYFVHGDPLSLLAGSQLQSDGLMTVDEIAEFEHFDFSGSIAFIEQEKLRKGPTTNEELEKENSTEASEAAILNYFKLDPYSFVQTADDTFILGADTPTPDSSEFLFKVVDNQLRLVSFDGVAVTVHHYSIKDDRNSFSFLASFNAPTYGKVLIAFYFSSSETENPFVKTEGDYAYYVDDIKIPWEGPIHVEACGADLSSAESSSMEKSVEAWFADASPSTAPQTVIYTQRSDFAPFSDLNQHCLYLLPNFRFEDNNETFTAGVTIGQINKASKAFFDSDVFLFTTHSYVSKQLDGDASTTLMHELGHFFGLGHEFKTDAQGRALYPSVMGYSSGTDGPTVRDFSAIKDLYGESLTGL